MKIENARITRTHFGPEDHGILTATLYLDGDGHAGSFGGYNLSRNASEYIARLLTTLDVERWEALPGKYVRTCVVGNMYRAIGHIIEDRWFICDLDGPRIVKQSELPQE